MKPLVSGVIGALAAGLMVSAWHGRTSAEQELTIARPAASAVHLASQGAGTAADQNAAFSPVNVQCAPGQRAIVRQVPTTQGLTSDVQCVSVPGDETLVWDGYAAPAPAPRVVPAVYSAPAPQQVIAREPTVRRTSGRTWKKSALVIGGSAGAGAGVGALAGGKKGALIGAAIGGGAATLYEATKHR